MQTISTSHIDPDRKIDFWESWNQSSLVGLRCSAPRPEVFYASSTQHIEDGTQVTRIQAAQHLIDRSAQSISRAPKNAVFVSTLVSGSGFVFDTEGLRQFHSGDILIYSTMHPYILGFDREIDLIIVDLDADLVQHEWNIQLGNHPRIIGRKLANQDFPGRALRLLDEASEISDRKRSTIELVQCCHALLKPSAPSAVLYEQALAMIRGNSANPDYSAARLAADLHVSDRHLRRIFHEHDTSPGEALHTARLGCGREMLTSEPFKTVSDVAATCGFGSPSSFTRAFRALYGMSPSELRSKGNPPMLRNT